MTAARHNPLSVVPASTDRPSVFFAALADADLTREFVEETFADNEVLRQENDGLRCRNQELEAELAERKAVETGHDIGGGLVAAEAFFPQARRRR